MIGVVGERDVARQAARELEAAGEPAVATPFDARDAEELDLVVAIGEDSLARAAAAEPTVPVLPTELAAGADGVDTQAICRDVEQYHAGSAELRPEPLLVVSANGEPVGPSVLDVMLVRSEPGRISEFSWTAGQDRARFRADGVVLATPRGSHGYARAAGGPRLGLDTTAVAITPVAPFGLGAPVWIEPPAADIEFRVERDEGAVSLLLDGREQRRFAGRSTVTVSPEGSLRTIVTSS